MGEWLCHQPHALRDEDCDSWGDFCDHRAAQHPLLQVTAEQHMKYMGLLVPHFFLWKPRKQQKQKPCSKLCYSSEGLLLHEDDITNKLGAETGGTDPVQEVPLTCM